MHIVETEKNNDALPVSEKVYAHNQGGSKTYFNIGIKR